MRTALFTYDFPHRKSQEFLVRMAVQPDDFVLAIGAPHVAIDSPKPHLRTKPHSQSSIEPRALCRVLGVPYRRLPHNSEQTRQLLIDAHVDVVLIGGARILKQPVIDAPRIGIVNFHPGLIPEVRGLDALKWSVYKGVPPGVTAHLIDERVDAGRIVVREQVPVYADDGWLDLSLRLDDRQVELIPDVLRMLRRQPDPSRYPLVEEGEHSRSMPPELEAEIQTRFEDWKTGLSVRREAV